MPDSTPGMYRQAFRKTASPTIITDTNYLIQDVNDACVEFTGYSREELLGDYPRMLFSDPEIYKSVLASLENGDRWTGFIETETKEGDQIYGRGTVRSLYFGGEKQGYLGIFIDLTERRMYEQALKVVHRLLRHDLRNEMNLVEGYASNIEREVDTTNEQVTEYAQKIQQITDRLVRRADRARHLEELLYEGLGQPLCPVSITDVLHEQVARARERFEDAEFVVRSVPECEVSANDLLEEVLACVLENAVVYNEGEIHVEISADEADDSVVVSIADNGPGIPDQQKDQIFGREEKDALQHGEGFSLYFSELVLASYDGSISVEDNEMGGATFTIRCPKA